MWLAPPENVVKTMGLISNAGTLESAQRALALSYPIIETVLESELQEAITADFFSLEGTGLQTLRLSHLFIAEDGLEIRGAVTADPLFDETEGELLDPKDYFVDRPKGLVTLRDPWSSMVGSHRLSVLYESGLPKDSSVASGELLVAPYWLQEVAVSLAVYVLNTHPSTSGNRGKDKTVVNVANEIFTTSSLLLSGKRRSRMSVLQPDRVKNCG